MDLGFFLSIDLLLRFFRSLFDIPFKKDEYTVKIKLDSDNQSPKVFSVDKTCFTFFTMEVM